MVLGEHDVSLEEGTEQRRQVAEVVLYSGRFGRSRGPQASLQSDIALVRLDQPAVFTEFVQPIDLPETTDDFTGETGGCFRAGKSQTNTGTDKLSMVKSMQYPQTKR